MAKRILVIGAHGMLGRPVTRRLLKDGFSVRAMARNPSRTSGLLPPGADLVYGDLEKIETIDSALSDCDAVYVSVDTPRQGLNFSPETDGLRNVAQAALNHKNVRLMMLSAYEAGKSSDPWWHVRHKKEAQAIAKGSGLSWTIFEPAWFYESLPLFIQKKSYLALSGFSLLSYWISGDDYARMISTALETGKGAEKTIVVQGKELLDSNEAGRRFIQTYDSSIKMKKVPMFMLRLMGLFSGQMGELVKLFDHYAANPEKEPDPEIWKEYGEPEMSIEDYANYIQETGDFPTK